MISIKAPILALLLATLVIPPQAYGKPPLETFGLINAAERKGEISRDEATRHRAWAILDRKRLPARFITDETKTKSVKHATTLLREIKRDWDSLSPETKEELSPYLFKKKGRPVGKTAFKSTAETTAISGGRKVVLDGIHLMLNNYSTTNFNIEWGDDVNTLDLTDDPFNGIPDIVEEWGVYLEKSWADIVVAMDYAPPLESNDYLVDVYIGGTDGDTFPIADNLYGYTDTYIDSGIPFMVVNNYYNGWPHPNTDSGGWVVGAMKVTAAHEFFHTVHFTIDYWEDAWWMEASSTWMEDAVFDDTNDYYNYIKTGTNWPFYPNVSLLHNNGDHEYGDVIFAKYLSEYQGGTTAIKSVWDNCITVQGASSVSGLSTFFVGRSTSLSNAYQDFTVKNLSMDYAEGSNYGSMKIRSTHNTYPLSQNSLDLPPSDPDYLGSNYIQFTPAGGTDLTLAFDGDEYFNGRTIEWGAKIVLFTGAAYSSIDIPLDPSTQSGTLKVTSYSTYSTIYLVPSVLSSTGVTPSERDQTPYSSYPEGVPYAYEACIDCVAPTLPLMEFKDNDTPAGGVSGGDGGGCFIATAAFGFYSDPQVMILRHFRDRFLLTNDPGRWFVKSYYRHSPPIAQLIRENGWLKTLARILLLPVIATAWLTLDAFRLTFFLTFFVLTSMIINRRKRPAR